MRCSTCNSEFHLRRWCPQGRHSSKGTPKGRAPPCRKALGSHGIDELLEPLARGINTPVLREC
eukprot:12884696-Prorocentrum_lima.AAC.1